MEFNCNKRSKYINKDILLGQYPFIIQQPSYTARILENGTGTSTSDEETNFEVDSTFSTF